MKSNVCILGNLTHISLASFFRTQANRIAPDGSDAAKRGVASGAILFPYINEIKMKITPDAPKTKVDSSN